MEYELIKHLEGTSLKTFVVTINQRALHFHSDIELLMVLEGSILVDDGKERHMLKKGDMFMQNKNEIHSLKQTQDTNILLVVQFDPNLCKPYYPKIARVRFSNKHITQQKWPGYWAELKQCMADMVHCYTQKRDGYSIGMMGILNRLLYTMIRDDDYVVLDEKVVVSQNRNMERLNRIVEHMRQNFMYHMTLKDIAEKEKLDMYYLSHFIKSHLGISFQKYLSRLRVEKAEQLLLHTDLNNIDVCMECGFSDYKYLNKAFLDEFGCTPQAYKERYRESLPELFQKESSDQHVVRESVEAFLEVAQYLKQ